MYYLALHALRCILFVAAGCGRLQFDPLATDDAAVSVDTMVSACSNYVVAHASSFTTTSDTFVDVPGGSLELPATGDRWLLLASAGLRSTSNNQHSVEVHLRVDGDVRTAGEAQNAADKPMPWLHADIIPASAQAVDVQVRDIDQTGTIENLKLVAYRIPASTEAVISEFRAVQVVGTAYTPVVSATITPTTTGNFLVLASGTASEEPSMSDISLRLVDNMGAIWPMPSNGTQAFANGRATWRSVLWARSVMLSPGTHTFSVEAEAASSSGSVRDLRIMIIPGSPLGLSGVQTLPPADATTSQPVEMATFSLAAPATPVDVVTLQALTVAGTSDPAQTNPMIVDFLRDGVSRAHYENYDQSGGPVLPFGFVDAFTQTAATTFTNQFRVADPSRIVTGKESPIIVLSRACP